jgi:N-acyl homoserine lactone hydrolase
VGLRLVPLRTGTLHVDGAPFTGLAGPLALPVPSWLVEHPEGLVLFDTGLHGDLGRGTERLGRLGRRFTVDLGEDETVGGRLADRGIAPGDVGRAVLSHLHFDHCGGTAELPSARLVVQGDEWAAAHDAEQLAQGVYQPDDYDLGHAVELVDGGHDVFGDGTVVCVPTPGHTAGHQSLRVELTSGPVVLTADCVYLASMLDRMAVPAFGFDLDRQRASMRELRRLRDEEDCRLLFGHDLDQVESLPPSGLT